MTMTPKDRKLHDAEVARIRREMNLPDDVPVFILDVDRESADWIPGSNMTTKKSRKARAKFLASQNWEEGGE